MIKAILWDNDGVLVDTEKFYYLSTKKLFLKYGAELTREDYLEYYLKKNTGAWHLLGKKAGDSTFLDKLRKERGDIYSSYLTGEDHSVPGAKEVLKSLHQKYKMGIVTSSRREHFMAIHQQTGLLNYIDFTLVREDYEFSKPNPEPYLKALEIAGVQPEEALVIEDSERGLNAAITAGIKCWVIPSEFSEPGSFGKADKIFKNIIEIKNYL